MVIGISRSFKLREMRKDIESDNFQNFKKYFLINMDGLKLSNVWVKNLFPEFEEQREYNCKDQIFRGINIYMFWKHRST